MQTTTRLTSALRSSAVVLLMATFGTWVFTGAHVGWTQTSKTSIQRDEITGIDFPVRRAAFVAGVEVLVTGTAAAGVLIAMGAFTQRRHVRHAHAQVRQA